MGHMGGFPRLWVPFCRGPHNKDCSLLGFICFPLLGKRPYPTVSYSYEYGYLRALHDIPAWLDCMDLGFAVYVLRSMVLSQRWL